MVNVVQLLHWSMLKVHHANGKCRLPVLGWLESLSYYSTHMMFTLCRNPVCRSIRTSEGKGEVRERGKGSEGEEEWVRV